MKKLIALAIILTSMSATKGCEICGCGVNNFYIGVLPQFNHKFFGMRYHFNSFSTRMANDPGQFSRDFYQTVEIWGGWNLGKKLQLLTVVPFSHNYQNSDEGISKRMGLGDVVLLANYKLFDINSVGSNDNLFSQQFSIGGGVKLPTGTFHFDNSDPDVASAANGQLGSGSVDFLLDAIYNIRIDKLGINTTATYKINSSNKQQYKFGDKFTASSFAFYPLSVSKTIVAPNIGILYEKTQASELAKGKIDLTGGSIVQGSAGVDVSFSKIAVGFNIQLPLVQNFAQDQTKEKVKGMGHISFAF